MLDFRIKSSLHVYATVFHHASLFPFVSFIGSYAPACIFFYYIVNDNDPLLNGFNKARNGEQSEAVRWCYSSKEN